MNMIVFLTAAAHMFYTPFTKVEESFNLQAMHDILYLRHNFTQYDHHEYPGVVPRTFLGPLFISILSTPFVLLFETLRMNKFWAQYVVRLVLAAVIATAWNNFQKVVMRIFHGELTMWFTLITISQFHFIFYMSRPLPNIMALPVVLTALAYWLKGQTKPFIISSGIAIIVFRSELVIFLGLLLLYDLVLKKISIDKVMKIAIPAGIAILVTTIIVDSLFWKRLLWPEGQVLWYNTILNKSSDWGTSPFLWYFYSALPRAMGVSLLFVPIGVYLEPRIRPLVFAAIGFVLIYSLLPHKELRFIIYVFPVLNLAAASGCNRFWINNAKSMWHGFLAMCAGGHILLNILLTVFLLVISGTNYPGGVALSRLHRLEANSQNVSVHIANLAAQSGVSRFMEIRDDWRYCKNESLSYVPEDIKKYTHLLVEAKTKYNTPMWNTLQEEFDTIEFIDCFSNIGIQYNSFVPMRIKTKPCIAILKRRQKKIPLVTEVPKVIEKFEEIDDDPIENIDTVNNDFIDEVQASINEVPVVEEKLETVSKELESETKNIEIKETEDADDDGIEIANVSLETNELSSVEDDEASGHTKEINFLELRNLALGRATKKTTKATKLKIRKIIEQHYRAKGRSIENDSAERHESDKSQGTEKRSGTRQTVKSIIRQERIKEMIEQISQMDLMSMCDLNKVTTKDCLKQVIDKMDEDGSSNN